MANHLEVAKVLSIQTLHAQGWSQRRIARELGINRESVARHLKEAAKSEGASVESADSKPAKAPPGSDPDGDDSCPSGKRAIADFAASGGRLLGPSGFGFDEHAA